MNTTKITWITNKNLPSLVHLVAEGFSRTVCGRKVPTEITIPDPDEIVCRACKINTVVYYNSRKKVLKDELDLKEAKRDYFANGGTITKLPFFSDLINVPGPRLVNQTGRARDFQKVV